MKVFQKRKKIFFLKQAINKKVLNEKKEILIQNISFH